MKRILTVGQKINNFTFVGYSSESDNAGHRKVNLTCVCGKNVCINKSSLFRSKKATMSCGCIRSSTRSQEIDYKIGDRFGRLLLQSINVEYDKKSNNRVVYGDFLCDCGKSVRRKMKNITAVAGTRSCGCLYTDSRNASDQTAFNTLYDAYIRNAASGDRQFDLTKEQFLELTQKCCTYCGLKPSQVKKSGKHEYVYNGIDRVNNSIGYTYSNCVTCCKQCNFTKRNMNVAEFKEYIKRLCEFNRTQARAISMG